MTAGGALKATTGGAALGVLTGAYAVPSLLVRTTAFGLQLSSAAATANGSENKGVVTVEEVK